MFAGSLNVALADRWACWPTENVYHFTLLIVYFHVYSFDLFQLNYPCIIFKTFCTPQLCMGIVVPEIWDASQIFSGF